MGKKSEAEKVASNVKSITTDVDATIDHLQAAVSRINGGLELIKPDKIILEDKGEVKKSVNNELQFTGKDRKNGATIQRTMEQEMEERYRKISYYTSGGIYKKLFMAKQNKYLASEFPNLKKALKLFITDVCYGSFFAPDVATEKFQIYENGILIEDKNIKDQIAAIINPPATKKDDVSSMTFNDLDFNATYLMRQDGYGFIRLIPNKKVLLDLYLKYVMKNAKTSVTKAATETVKLKDDEGVNSLNEYLDSLGYTGRKVGIESNLVKELPEHILKTIPESLVTRTSSETQIGLESEGNPNSKPTPDGFEQYEGSVYANESFQEFAYRMLSGKGSTSAIYNNATQEKAGKYHVYSIGYGPTSYSTEVGMDIYNEAFVGNGVKTIGLESELADSLDEYSSRLNVFNKTALENVTYEEIYSVDTNLVLAKIEETISSTLSFGMEKYIFKNKQAKKSTPVFTALEMVAKNILTEDNTVIPGIESELQELGVNIKPGKEENTFIGLESIAENFRALDGIKDNSYVKRGTVKLKQETDGRFDKVVGKVTKMFDNVKGVNTVLIDNRRLIPAMMGNKNNGGFYIEKTHAEIEHLIATRSIMSSPIAGGDSTTSLFQLDEETKEETMGRLIFSDTIKPLIERNMSTKFLKDNADLMYTIKELLEENEISKTDRAFGAFNDMGYFNLSKVSYIPANELIMYTNGTGLGESVFEDAFTPANAYVLSRESYLSWMLVDGKGMCIVEVPKGLNEIGGEYGSGHFERMIEENMCTRISLKTGSTDNMQLSRRVLTLAVPDEMAGKININDIKPPEFDIDNDVIAKWQEEATGVVGYPASLFSTLDGGGIELAKKIESMNSSIVLDIMEAQDRKVQSSNALATALLHYRGGKDYEKYDVEWIPPRPTRANDNIKKEMVTERKETVESYMSIYESQLGEKPEWELAKPHLFNVLAKKMYTDDQFLNNMQENWKEALMLSKIDMSSNADEK